MFGCAYCSSERLDQLKEWRVSTGRHSSVPVPLRCQFAARLGAISGHPVNISDQRSTDVLLWYGVQLLKLFWGRMITDCNLEGAPLCVCSNDAGDKRKAHTLRILQLPHSRTSAGQCSSARGSCRALRRYAGPPYSAGYLKGVEGVYRTSLFCASATPMPVPLPAAQCKGSICC